MHRRPLIVLAAAALCLLAACETTTTTTVISPPLDDTFGASPSVLFPPGAPVVPRVETEPLSELPDPVVANCMSAVAQRSGNNVVSPVSVQGGASGTIVVVGVGENRAAWECRADPSGSVVEVTSVSGEGDS